MRKLQNLARMLNDDFRVYLRSAMADEFDGLEVETTANIFSMSLTTRRVDGADFTPEQMKFLKGWSEGYAKALELVHVVDRLTTR